LNLAAFPVPSTERQGTAGRNIVSGFGFAQMDLALRRDFRLGERVRLQLRAEAFNLTNHPNFGNPVGSAQLWFGSAAPSRGLLDTYYNTAGSGGALAGGPTTGLTRDLQIGGPRTLQLQLKLRF
jgi:hypothetical protein